LTATETLNLVLGAFSTLSQGRGVKIGNMEWRGVRFAVAFIADAQFEKDEQGRTLLANCAAGAAVQECANDTPPEKTGSKTIHPGVHTRVGG
jgi:hypothetical protein